MKDQFSPAGGGINVLGQAFEAYPPLLKSSHRGDQMRQGATQPVESPDNKGIAFPNIAECLFQSLSLCLCTACCIGEDAVAPCVMQGVLLQIEGLFLG